MGKIKKYLTNGGKRSIIEIVIQILIYIIILSFFAGRVYSEKKEMYERINRLEQKQECLEEIKIRLKALEENQQRILEILQGKYR